MIGSGSFYYNFRILNPIYNSTHNRGLTITYCIPERECHSSLLQCNHSGQLSCHLDSCTSRFELSKPCCGKLDMHMWRCKIRCTIFEHLCFEHGKILFLKNQNVSICNLKKNSPYHMKYQSFIWNCLKEFKLSKFLRSDYSKTSNS